MVLQGHVAHTAINQNGARKETNVNAIKDMRGTDDGLSTTCEKNLVFCNQYDPTTGARKQETTITTFSDSGAENTVKTMARNADIPVTVAKALSMSAGSQFRATPWPEIWHSHAV